jgi:hypothetical protein
MIKLEAPRPPMDKRLPEWMVFAGLAGMIAYPLAALTATSHISWRWRAVLALLFLALYVFALLFPV